MLEVRPQIGIRTIGRYLIGDRQAIEAIGQSKSILWVGMLFVLSAGMAREYDGEDLLHEPWYAFLPLVVSTAAATLLWGLLWVVVQTRERDVPIKLFSLRNMIGFYWLMAPMAWLYAIPFERFLSPLSAMQANLWLLTWVATWRVLLMSRVISVSLGCQFYWAFFPVMLFADAVSIAALHLTPQPIWDFMGGVRMSPPDLALMNTICTAKALTILSLPLWLLGSVVAAMRMRASPKSEGLVVDSPNLVSKSLRVLAVGSVLIWGLVLPWAQTEQQNRRLVEKLASAGDFQAALVYMSARNRSDFPPHWEVPPRIGWSDSDEDYFIEIIHACLMGNHAPWVQQLYAEKFRFYTLDPNPNYPSYLHSSTDLIGMSESFEDNDPRVELVLDIVRSSRIEIKPDARMAARISEYLSQHKLSGTKLALLNELLGRFRPADAAPSRPRSIDQKEAKD